jgi:glycosyltransferase involved in cell wall biosynthesis
MPVFNERETIEEIVSRVLSVPLRVELIVIDDASTDGSRELLQKLAAEQSFKLLLQDTNCGKGAAVRRGFEDASGDIFVIQDASSSLSCAARPTRSMARVFSVVTVPFFLLTT